MDDIDKLKNEILNSETFCFYPYVQISSNPIGYLKPCCNYAGPMYHSNKQPISILNGDRLEDFWNSSALVSLRKNLHQNETVHGCRRCWRDGDNSMRKRSIKEYIDDQKTLLTVLNTIKDDYKNSTDPSYLELKPSNLCNLKCVMCNSYDSSQVAKELNELSKKYGGIKVHDGRFVEISSTPGIEENLKVRSGIDQPEWSDNSDVWNSFIRMAPNLEILSFAGGEPTIMPFVLKALQYVVDNDYAKNIKVFLASNFTNLNVHFLEIMPRFKNFELIASIDGYDKVNDYCRFPSKWKQVSKNYIEAKKYMSNSNVKILTNITVGSLNVLNLDDLLYFIDDQSLIEPHFKHWRYNINLIMYPLEQQVFMLPKELKDIASERLTNYLIKSQVIKNFPNLASKIHFLLSELKKDDDPTTFSILKNRIKVLDEHRKIHIGDYIPEISELFK